MSLTAATSTWTTPRADHVRERGAARRTPGRPASPPPAAVQPHDVGGPSNAQNISTIRPFSRSTRPSRSRYPSGRGTRPTAGTEDAKRLQPLRRAIHVPVPRHRRGGDEEHPLPRNPRLQFEKVCRRSCPSCTGADATAPRALQAFTAAVAARRGCTWSSLRR